MNKGKRTAQTTAEIVSDIVENKEKQISRTRGNGLYPRERNELVDNTITRLVGLSFDQMSEFATSEHISLTDITELKTRSLIYLKACEDNAVFPCMSGLARCLGYSRQELDNWRSKHQGTEVSRWLNTFADACLETLHQAALTKNISEITTIFLSKSLYGLTETSRLELTQGQGEIKPEINQDALRAEYEAYAKEHGIEINYESED